MLGHTSVDLAGTMLSNAPVAMGIIDTGDYIGEMSFNHTGALGLGFWEDNMPNWFLLIDPSLSLMAWQSCGNTFYPIPGAPVGIMKDFMLWGIPFVFPAGFTFKWSFYYGDRGGCFFMGSASPSKGKVNYLTRTAVKFVMAIPIAIKFIAPSWLFIISDVKIRGKSIQPCMAGICKGTVHTGRFSTSGPLVPMLKILEEASAPKTCEHMENLPDVTFTISGTEFTMGYNDYVIQSESYGSLLIECMQ